MSPCLQRTWHMRCPSGFLSISGIEENSTDVTYPLFALSNFLKRRYNLFSSSALTKQILSRSYILYLSLVLEAPFVECWSDFPFKMFKYYFIN